MHSHRATRWCWNQWQASRVLLSRGVVHLSRWGGMIHNYLLGFRMFLRPLTCLTIGLTPLTFYDHRTFTDRPCSDSSYLPIKDRTVQDLTKRCLSPPLGSLHGSSLRTLPCMLCAFIMALPTTLLVPFRSLHSSSYSPATLFSVAYPRRYREYSSYLPATLIGSSFFLSAN